jgi:hypothetical protein
VTVLLKLIYAGAIAALLVLSVAFGIRTFASPPEAPEFPKTPVGFRPVGPGPDPQTSPAPTAEQREFEEAQRRFQDDFERYEHERADYHSQVFIAASILAIVAVAGGLWLPGALDAIRLGLVAGGVGTLIYGVIQASGDLDEAGATVVFVVVLVGLALVLVSGYRWLAARAEE